MRRFTQSFAATILLVALAGLSFERAARSEPSAADKAAAETLFVNARKLMTDGKYDEACKALAESQRLDPGVGTLLNLGRCYEKLGRTASAWSTYREAAGAARASHQTTREKYARTAADALEKTLPMLTVAVSGGERAPDLEVRRDGAVVPHSLWGMAVAIDPGEHIFDASAPHSKPWRMQVVAEAGKPLTVTVPALEPDGKALAAASSAARVSAPPVAKNEKPAEPVPPKGSGLGPQRVAALVTGAAGLAATGLGGYFAYRAKSDYDRAEPCNDQNQCELDGYNQRVAAAHTANSTATLLVGGGLVAIAGGVVLWVTAPTRRSDDAAKVPAPRSRVWVSADPFGAGGSRSFVLSGVF
jgi:serine/threonine-protein kinase